MVVVSVLVQLGSMVDCIRDKNFIEHFREAPFLVRSAWVAVRQLVEDEERELLVLACAAQTHVRLWHLQRLT